MAEPLQGCRRCGLVCRSAIVRCPRCQTPLTDTSAPSTTACRALLLAAMMLYIPANLLPVTRTHIVGYDMESTLFSGIRAFWNNGAPGIAAIIFIASVAIPAMKFIVMIFLLLSTRRGTLQSRRQRTLLYHLLEWTGYWSMLDVVVVVVVSGLVQFHDLASIEPRVGILFFALVVVLTMLSVLSFDPRLIWKTTP